MLLSDIFTYLSCGEFSQYELGTANNGIISETDYPKITSYINRGLTQLHSKLPLRLEQVLLTVDHFQSRYILNSKYAMSNTTSTVDNKYIQDLYSPFKDNLIKIEQVINSDNEEMTLNNAADEHTVYTPMPNVVQFSQPTMGTYGVVYRATHPLLSMERGIDPSTVQVDLVDSLLEPLLTFVSARLVSAKGGAEGIQLSMALMQSFNMQIADMETQGVFNTDIRKQERIWSDRWV